MPHLLAREAQDRCVNRPSLERVTLGLLRKARDAAGGINLSRAACIHC